VHLDAGNYVYLGGDSHHEQHSRHRQLALEDPVEKIRALRPLCLRRKRDRCAPQDRQRHQRDTADVYVSRRAGPLQSYGNVLTEDLKGEHRERAKEDRLTLEIEKRYRLLQVFVLFIVRDLFLKHKKIGSCRDAFGELQLNAK
jgi:hypothetical protein